MCRSLPPDYASPSLSPPHWPGEMPVPSAQIHGLLIQVSHSSTSNIGVAGRWPLTRGEDGPAHHHRALPTGIVNYLREADGRQALVFGVGPVGRAGSQLLGFASALNGSFKHQPIAKRKNSILTSDTALPLLLRGPTHLYCYSFRCRSIG